MGPSTTGWQSGRELLYYVRGKPPFTVQYTDIPKILRGYYKEVNGQITENVQRGKSENLCAGNVWVDVQQVFYRIEEERFGLLWREKPLAQLTVSCWPVRFLAIQCSISLLIPAPLYFLVNAMTAAA